MQALAEAGLIGRCVLVPVHRLEEIRRLLSQPVRRS